MSNIKAIIFDCFGVIYPQASGDFFERHKKLFNNDSSPLDGLNLKIDLGIISRKEFFIGLESVTDIPAIVIQSEIDQELWPDTDLIAFIKELNKSYKIGLLSNAGQEEIAIIFRDKVDALFDATAISYELGVVKPNTEIFVACAKRLGVKPEDCLFIDDSMVNIEAAEKLGMKTLYYPSFGIIPDELNNLPK
ncbi:hypothetical protein A3F37_04095 [Candidatus Saccharibacteria bacterium RIFCSPHIGHO2_12_FULL_41_12]|nr:MAG: hypothetical protein A3F37_04095 [Candidatus Saccharibacteria bacterium RIFCSPHIGHO2_12_FULL_41_12]